MESFYQSPRRCKIFLILWRVNFWKKNPVFSYEVNSTYKLKIFLKVPEFFSLMKLKSKTLWKKSHLIKTFTDFQLDKPVKYEPGSETVYVCFLIYYFFVDSLLFQLWITIT